MNIEAMMHGEKQTQPSHKNNKSSAVVYVCHEDKNRTWAHMIMAHLAKKCEVKLWEYSQAFSEPHSLNTFFLLLPFRQMDNDHPTRKFFFKKWRPHATYLMEFEFNPEKAPQWLDRIQTLPGIEKLNSDHAKEKQEFYRRIENRLDQLFYRMKPKSDKNPPHTPALVQEKKTQQGQERQLSTQMRETLAEANQSLQSGDLESERNKLKQARARIRHWSHLLVCVGHLLDNLYFDFLDMVEEQEPFEIQQNRFILALSLDSRNLEDLNDLVRSLHDSVADLHKKEEKISVETLSNSVLGIPRVNIRNGGEQDFSFTKTSMETGVLNFQKRTINNLLLLSKLIIKSHAEATRTLTWLQEKQEKVWRQPRELDYHRLLDCLLQQRLDEFHAILQDRESVVEEYFNLIRANEEISSEIRSRFLSLMEKSMFRVLNDLRRAGLHYRETVDGQFACHPDREAMEGWASIYAKLEALLKKNLVDLDIGLIAPERGEGYNPDRHNPYIEAEADPELQDDQIKETVNWGFIQGEDVLKPADVIVVRNGQPRAI